MRPQLRLDIGAVFIYLSLGSMFSAVPRYITEELDGSKAMAGLSVSIFFVAAIITRPIVGRMIDRIGRRPFLIAPPLILAALMVAMLGAHWIPSVLVVRFVQGIAGSAFYVAAVTTSTDLAPADRRASAVARLSIAIYMGFAVGPFFGELLTDQGSRVTWLSLAAVMLVGAAFAFRLPETRPEPDAEAAPVGRQPFIHRAAILPGVVLLALGVGYTSVTAHSALYARSIGMTSSGWLYVAFALSVLIVRLGSGRLADAVGPLKVLFPGIGSLAGGLLLLAFGDRTATAIVGVAMVGTGWALVFPAIVSWMSVVVPDAQRGAALGSLVAFMDVGQGFGGYLVGAVADGQGFGWAYTLPAVLALASTIPMVLAVRNQAEPVPLAVVGPAEV